MTLGALLASGATLAGAQDDERSRTLEEVIVVAPYGLRAPQSLVPASFQSATAQEIERVQPLDLTDFINRSFGSVNINHAQNNPLQPDVNFRGFTASPLLGLSPGLTVYQNGVRINEPFGDTVNWDLIPLSAVQELQLLAGTNPLFGLNTLGGALSLRMKNGFDYVNTEAEAYGGSFGRRAATIEHGGNDGRFGYYANVDYFEEDGWRDYSNSEALRFFGSLSVRGSEGALDVSAAWAQTELRGNGASPVELLALDREQVFTHPDLTENTLKQLIVEGSQRLSDRVEISGNAFYREIDTDTFNGDGTIFEECDFGDEEFLVEEEFTDLNGDDECSALDDADIELVLDLNGEPIEAEADGEELNAINNLGWRDQEVYGLSLQASLRSGRGGLENELTFGGAYSESRTSFNSIVEVAHLLANRATSRTGVFASEFLTDVGSEVTIASLYLADTVQLTDRTALVFAGRYDNTRVRLEDRTGASPELNGSHEFERFNPSVGVTFQLTPSATFYASAGQSARAPTPVELACASEDAPCNLPNAFLADPPLEQVVATSFEAGVRGDAANGIRWRAGAFRTTNDDDILFQTTGGAQANVGFFANVGDTRRQGLELGVSQRTSRVRWFADYSYIEATFETPFLVNSPNHPIFDADPDAPVIVGEGKIQVDKGDEIPGIPRHQVNLGADYFLTDRISIGADALYRSGVYLRGDEANLLSRTNDYIVLNLRAQWRLNDHVTFFARVENALDEDYETFGLLGEPDEVFEDFEDPRFLGAGPPAAGWIGVNVKL